MNFKEALIAHLQGEKVEVFAQFPSYDKPQYGQHKWRSFGDFYSSFELGDSDNYSKHSGAEYRLAPRTIFVNGVEVTAPESAALEYGCSYYVATTDDDDCASESTWTGHRLDLLWLKRGLVYLNKEDAIARAKAMLLTSDK